MGAGGIRIAGPACQKGSLMIETYLDDLERRIDPAVEDELFRQWKAFADGQFTGGSQA